MSFRVNDPEKLKSLVKGLSIAGFDVEEGDLNNVDNLNEIVFQLSKENEEVKENLEFSLNVIDEKEKENLELKNDINKLENYYGLQINDLELKISELMQQNSILLLGNEQTKKKKVPSWLNSEILSNIPKSEKRRTSFFEPEEEENEGFEELKKLLENKDKTMQEMKEDFERKLRDLEDSHIKHLEGLKSEVDKQKEVHLFKDLMKVKMAEQLKEQDESQLEIISHANEISSQNEKLKLQIAKLKEELDETKKQAQKDVNEKFMQIIKLNKKIDDAKFMSNLHEQERIRFINNYDSLKKLYDSQKKQMDILSEQYNRVKDDYISLKDKIKIYGGRRESCDSWLKIFNTNTNRATKTDRDESDHHHESDQDNCPSKDCNKCDGNYNKEHKTKNESSLMDLLDDEEGVEKAPSNRPSKFIANSEEPQKVVTVDPLQPPKQVTETQEEKELRENKIKELSLKKTKLNWLNKIRNKKVNNSAVLNSLKINDKLKEISKDSGETTTDSQEMTVVIESNEVVTASSQIKQDNEAIRNDSQEIDNKKQESIVKSGDLKIGGNNLTAETTNSENLYSSNLNTKQEDSKLKWLRGVKNKEIAVNTLQVFNRFAQGLDKVSKETQTDPLIISEINPMSSGQEQGKEKIIKRKFSDDECIIVNQTQIILLAEFNIKKICLSVTSILGFTILNLNPDIEHQKSKTENEYEIRDLNAKLDAAKAEVEDLTRENFSLKVKIENEFYAKDVEINKLKILIKKMKEHYKLS